MEVLFSGNRKALVEKSGLVKHATSYRWKFLFSGNRKALVEKSGLVKHATSYKQKDQPKPPPSEPRTSSNRSVPLESVGGDAL